MTALDVRQPAQPAAALAIRPGQTMWDDYQTAALDQIGLRDASNADRAVFLHQCQRTGLDPFAKQIYMIGRKSKGETKWTIQTGIDGYRVLGDRVAERRGDEIEHDEPLWADDSGVWHDVWIWGNAPSAAKYVIRKNGKRFAATVMYREFVQTNFNGEPNAMWSKMPCNQLAKCAEVQAWKKVYPNDFAGLVLEDAAQPNDDAPSAPQRAKSARVTTDEILPPRVEEALSKARAQHGVQQPEPEPEVDTETVDRSDEVAELFNADADSEA